MEGNREKVRGWTETLSYCRSDGGAYLVQLSREGVLKMEFLFEISSTLQLYGLFVFEKHY